MFNNLNPILLALLAGTITFLITALGSSIVFFFKKTNKIIHEAMLSFSSGIMIAASFFSLILPAIETQNTNILLPTVIGFIGGTILLFILEKLCSKLENKKSLLLLFSITLHNIPEGLAIGVAFGTLAKTNIGAAFAVALGIGLQNFPEGAAISLPLLKEGYTKTKAFIYGSLSAIVEPIFACLGAYLVTKTQTLLPYMLMFAASAMIFVSISELIPESQKSQKKDIMSIVFMIGFLIMTILDLMFS